MACFDISYVKVTLLIIFCNREVKPDAGGEE